ncbi:MAG: alpha/beta hydrolase [Verrucomicrobiales bacterium]
MNLPTEFRNRTGERIDHVFHPGVGEVKENTIVIIAHGLTGNLDRPQLAALADGLSERGWPCLRISYPGNGNSEGNFGDCTITKEANDLTDLLDLLPANCRIAYAGHSMGGAVGAMAAARDARIQTLVSLAGMVHTAAFYEREFGSLVPDRDCLWEEEQFPLSAAFANDLRSMGDVLASATRVTVPWLFLHGAEDDLVPVQDSRDAYAVAPGPKKIVEIPDAGHSFDESSYAVLVREIDEWLRAHLG